MAEQRPSAARAARLVGEIAVRAETARRLEGSASEAVLRSIVEATVALFHSEAASIALYDRSTDRLVFEVAAGAQGQGVIGLAIRPDQGIAGYVFTTGQALALSDVASDPRFGRAVAERTGYIPRSIVAVPLTDEQGTIGVLQVLDKRDSASFSLRDIELAGVFARQAAVAITASRVERDVAALLGRAARMAAGPDAGEQAIEDVVAIATRELDRDDDSRLWALVDEVARIRRADPAQLGLIVEVLEVLARRAERARARRRG